jgi:hypothetical protein
MSQSYKNIPQDDDFPEENSPRKEHKTSIRQNRRKKEHERNNHFNDTRS